MMQLIYKIPRLKPVVVASKAGYCGNTVRNPHKNFLSDSDKALIIAVSQESSSGFKLSY